MSPSTITLATTLILHTHIPSRRIIANILNKNIPVVGNGEINQFHSDHVENIILFGRRNQRDFAEYIAAFHLGNENLQKTIMFLDDGGLNTLGGQPGAIPNRPLSYDALVETALAIVRAAGGEPGLQRPGSYVGTRETEHGAYGMRGMGDCQGMGGLDGHYAGGRHGYHGGRDGYHGGREGVHGGGYCRQGGRNGGYGGEYGGRFAGDNFRGAGFRKANWEEDLPGMEDVTAISRRTP